MSRTESVPSAQATGGAHRAANAAAASGATANAQAAATIAAPAGETWDFTTDSTLVRQLAANARVHPQRAAFREKDLGIWQETSWARALEMVLDCAAGLEALGF